MKLIYTCDDCGHTWRSDNYPEDSDEANGADCPKCGSDNVGGEEIKE